MENESIIKFKSMADILMSENTIFDKHGNLKVDDAHLSPCYFSMLGQIRKVKITHSFPYWCIESESRDALRVTHGLKIISKHLKGVDDELKDLADEIIAGKFVTSYGRYRSTTSKA